MYEKINEIIEVKFFDKSVYPEGLQFIEGKSDWVDLRCAKDIDLIAGSSENIPLGIAMKIPQGYEAYLLPRSSTFKNYGIIMANSMGVFDGSYCGDDDQWYFLAYPTRDAHISKGDRIAQFRIMKNQPGLIFNYVDHLETISRGGMGSTGIK